MSSHKEVNWRCPNCGALLEKSQYHAGGTICSNMHCRSPIYLDKLVLRGKALERAEAPMATPCGRIGRRKAFSVEGRTTKFILRKKSDHADKTPLLVKVDKGFRWLVAAE